MNWEDEVAKQILNAQVECTKVRKLLMDTRVWQAIEALEHLDKTHAILQDIYDFITG